MVKHLIKTIRDLLNSMIDIDNDINIKVIVMYKNRIGEEITTEISTKD